VKRISEKGTFDHSQRHPDPPFFKASRDGAVKPGALSYHSAYNPVKNSRLILIRYSIIMKKILLCFQLQNWRNLHIHRLCTSLFISGDTWGYPGDEW